MAKKKPAAVVPPQPPQIFEATRGSMGRVTRGAQIDQAQAEARRKAGEDVVVCGSDHHANRGLAGQIETGANGTAKRCPPHLNEGPYALPHYQPDPRPPEGHTFYETSNRRASVS
ncbi:MAG TPA: hypothetical protein VEL76_04345 [Gemmataceae bacterium]|nr:hypothetical protein [Gemmataceae bacterium]